MVEIEKINESTVNAHEFLIDFLAKFESAKRGGVHDLIEVSLFNMVNLAIKKLDDYLMVGHKKVSANEILAIIIDSYQFVLESMKKNLDSMNEINFH